VNRTIEQSAQTEPVPLWIGGKRVSPQSTRTGDVTNPATGEVIRKVPMVGTTDIDAAVEAARAAFPQWRDTTPLRRARLMQKFLTLLQANIKELAVVI
jgi:malonate-semialdehyde dehydrogenase (acetylating) / methylmalonate-semialdehyde dehydrogenase